MVVYRGAGNRGCLAVMCREPACAGGGGGARHSGPSPQVGEPGCLPAASAMDMDCHGCVYSGTAACLRPGALELPACHGMLAAPPICDKRMVHLAAIPAARLHEGCAAARVTPAAQQGMPLHGCCMAAHRLATIASSMSGRQRPGLLSPLVQVVCVCCPVVRSLPAEGCSCGLRS
jgi:hypothetical protein